MDPFVVLLLGILSLTGQLKNYGIDEKTIKEHPHLKDIRVRRHVSTPANNLDIHNKERAERDFEPFNSENKDNKQSMIKTDSFPFEGKDVEKPQLDTNALKIKDYEKQHGESQSYSTKDNDQIKRKRITEEKSLLSILKRDNKMRRRELSQERLKQMYDRYLDYYLKEAGLELDTSTDETIQYLEAVTTQSNMEDKDQNKLKDMPEVPLKSAKNGEENIKERYVPSDLLKIVVKQQSNGIVLDNILKDSKTNNVINATERQKAAKFPDMSQSSSTGDHHNTDRKKRSYSINAKPQTSQFTSSQQNTISDSNNSKYNPYRKRNTGYNTQYGSFNTVTEAYKGSGPYYNGKGPYYNGKGPYYNGKDPYYNGKGPYYNGKGPYYDGNGPKYNGTEHTYHPSGINRTNSTKRLSKRVATTTMRINRAELMTNWACASLLQNISLFGQKWCVPKAAVLKASSEDYVEQ